MRYHSLGKTGMRVSRYCLGTMMLGSRGNPDHADCIRMVHRALDDGINFVDTADTYSEGESETIVGKALAGRRDNVILATKAHFKVGPDINNQGNSRRWLVQEVENSLRRLNTDWIDLYQMHRPDPDTSLDEEISTLSDLVHEGKIRAFGHSSYPPEMIVKAQWVSEVQGLKRFMSEQSPYSILTRGIERSVLPVCQEYGMGVITYGPLAGAWLSGRFRSAEDIDMTTTRVSRNRPRYDPELPVNQHKLECINALDKVASDIGVPLTHLAVAFVASHPAVTAPIVGPRTMEQLEDTLAGMHVELDDATLDRIDEIVPPGTDIAHAPVTWTPPSLTEATLRRRYVGTRAVHSDSDPVVSDSRAVS